MCKVWWIKTSKITGLKWWRYFKQDMYENNNKADDIEEATFQGLIQEDDFKIISQVV